MSKTEYAWVIQRDDGKFYFDCEDCYYNDFLEQTILQQLMKTKV